MVIQQNIWHICWIALTVGFLLFASSWVPSLSETTQQNSSIILTHRCKSQNPRMVWNYVAAIDSLMECNSHKRREQLPLQDIHLKLDIVALSTRKYICSCFAPLNSTLSLQCPMTSGKVNASFCQWVCRIWCTFFPVLWGWGRETFITKSPKKCLHWLYHRHSYIYFQSPHEAVFI